MQRTHAVIDERSTFDTFADASVKDIVIFVHGIFGEAQKTWGDTRLQLISSPNSVHSTTPPMATARVSWS